VSVVGWMDGASVELSVGCAELSTSEWDVVQGIGGDGYQFLAMYVFGLFATDGAVDGWQGRVALLLWFCRKGKRSV
jgi:hypothetical protein